MGEPSDPTLPCGRVVGGSLSSAWYLTFCYLFRFLGILLRVVPVLRRRFVPQPVGYRGGTDDKHQHRSSLPRGPLVWGVGAHHGREVVVLLCSIIAARQQLFVSIDTIPFMREPVLAVVFSSDVCLSLSLSLFLPVVRCFSLSIRLSPSLSTSSSLSLYYSLALSLFLNPSFSLALSLSLFRLWG